MQVLFALLGLNSRLNNVSGLGQMQQDQRMADQGVASRENYEQAMQRSCSVATEMGLLERMVIEPLTPEQIAANRRRYGVTGQ